MKLKLLFAFLFLISFQTFAQDQKWSIEGNYPISLGDDLGNDNPGVLDLGIKYRFLDFKAIKIGLGLNVGVFQDRIRSFDNSVGELERTNFIERNWLIQPKIFTEFQIPGLAKLRPSLGLGYTVIHSTFNGVFEREAVSVNDSDGGFNVNLGLSYDLTKSLFVQAQYDYIRYNIRNDNPGDRDDNLGFLKLGVGFRF